MRCLVITSDKALRRKIAFILDKLSVLTVYYEDRQEEIESAILSIRPNLIFIECSGTDDEGYRKTYEFVENLCRRAVFVPIVANPTREIMRDILQQVLAVDVITADASKDRLLSAIHIAATLLSQGIKKEMDYYYGFFYFVGIQPTLKIRKALSDANLGMIQYRGINLLLNSLAAQPNSQIVGVCLNSDEELTSDQIASLGYDPTLEPIPWEIAMYEAQENYLNYWDEAIRAQLMPRMLPTVVQVTTDHLASIHPKVQTEIFERLGNIQRGESYLEALERAGYAAPDSDHDLPVYSKIYDMIEDIGVRMSEVDEQYPQLTRDERTSKRRAR